MKSFISIVLIFTVFVNLVFADEIEVTDEFSDPKNPGKCIIDQKLILLPGEEADHPEECAKILCEEDGLASIQRCDEEDKKVKKGCIEGAILDKRLPFPDCCEREQICVDDDSESEE